MWLHVAQGMEHRSGAKRMAASHPRSSTAIHEVASAREARSSSCSEAISSATSGEVSFGATSFEAAQLGPEVVVNNAIGEKRPSKSSGLRVSTPSCLLIAPKVTQERSKVAPFQERLDSCRQFIERAKKRMIRVDEVITRAVEQKEIFEEEVAQAEERLVLLQAEAVATTPVIPEPDQVKELQTQIDVLVREREPCGWEAVIFHRCPRPICRI